MTTSKSPKRVLTEALAVAEASLPAYSHRFSPKKFTLPQLFACLVLKDFYNLTYRGTVGLLADGDSLRAAIGLEQVPHFTTLQKAADRLLVKQSFRRLITTTVERARQAKILGRSVRLAAMDTSGFEGILDREGGGIMRQRPGGVALIVADIAKLDPDPGVFGCEAQGLLQGGGGFVELAEHALRLALERQGLGGGLRGFGGRESLIAKRDAGLEILAAVVAGLGLGGGRDQDGEDEKEGAHGGLQCGCRGSVRHLPGKIKGERRAALTGPGQGRKRAFVAICYRIAGHVKQAAKEVKGISPGTFGYGPGFFIGREARDVVEGLEDPHATGA